MLAAEPPSTTTTATSPHLGHRKPLQPKQNIFNFTNTNLYDAPPKPNSTTKTKTTHYQPPFPFEFTPPIINHPNKENMNVNTNKDIQLMDASLAEELTAVKRKLERLKSDKDKTRELLQQRDRVLEVQMTELLDRGQFQKELEIEVDRLYRLKHLKLACLRKSPIKSLRERQMEKMNKNSQLDVSNYSLRFLIFCVFTIWENSE
ncbi:High mobility group B protein 6 [Bienertia sinuspersici]